MYSAWLVVIANVEFWESENKITSFSELLIGSDFYYTHTIFCTAPFAYTQRDIRSKYKSFLLYKTCKMNLIANSMYYMCIPTCLKD